MTGTSSVSQSSDVLNQYRREEDKAAPKKNELGQNEFLKLMIAELNNQNPLDPKDNGEFIAQLAQFSQVEGLERLNKSTDKNIGIYPEIKNPKFHHENGKDFSKIVLEILTRYGYSKKDDQCILQCFDAQELERIRNELKSELFLVQLMEFPEQKTLLGFYASYADGIGPWYKHLLSSKTTSGFTFTSLVEEAHKLGLVVHPYTFRKDSLDEFDSFQQMIDVIIHGAGADGGFTDFPDRMREVLESK